MRGHVASAFAGTDVCIVRLENVGKGIPEIKALLHINILIIIFKSCDWDDLHMRIIKQ